jgi:Mn2+/Fe2+ NRAMP family transporter
MNVPGRNRIRCGSQEKQVAGRKPARKKPSKSEGQDGFLQRLGPGLITGAPDDDPSGIGTYSQAGAQLGFGIGWTMLITYPLMAAIQEISGRIGRVTGHGIAGNVCRNYPAPVIWSLIVLLFVANTINVAADLGAMGDALKLLIGGPAALFVVIFGTVSVLAQVFFKYERYVAILKWLTLVLFAYVIALFTVEVPWGEALAGLLIPKIQWNAAFLTTLVAILGTTISPYLFICRGPAYRSRQKATEKTTRKREERGKAHPYRHSGRDGIFKSYRHRDHHDHGGDNPAQLRQDIESSSQAAEALKPVAGAFAELIFALGIIGTGLLAIPVLAGSTAYAIGEGRNWPVGLSRKPKEAMAFYAVLALSVALGIALNFTATDPIKALYWSAVVNGVLAAPVMVIMMLPVRRKSVMGNLVVTGPVYWLGWIATGAMPVHPRHGRVDAKLKGTSRLSKAFSVFGALE